MILKPPLQQPPYKQTIVAHPNLCVGENRSILQTLKEGLPHTVFPTKVNNGLFFWPLGQSNLHHINKVVKHWQTSLCLCVDVHPSKIPNMPIKEILDYSAKVTTDSFLLKHRYASPPTIPHYLFLRPKLKSPFLYFDYTYNISVLSISVSYPGVTFENQMHDH